MHYKDGTEAKLGDLVKGIGYNGPDVIVGTVVHLIPGTEACNIRVAHAKVIPVPEGFRHPPHELFVPRGAIVSDDHGLPKLGVVADAEYGQCDAFELVYRPPVPGSE